MAPYCVILRPSWYSLCFVNTVDNYPITTENKRNYPHILEMKTQSIKHIKQTVSDEDKTLICKFYGWIRNSHSFVPDWHHQWKWNLKQNKMTKSCIDKNGFFSEKKSCRFLRKKFCIRRLVVLLMMKITIWQEYSGSSNLANSNHYSANILIFPDEGEKSH